MATVSKTSYPFFAYGAFKPGELGYLRIADYTDSFVEATAEGYLFERNGAAVFVDWFSGTVGGYLLDFSDPISAYEEIDAVEPSGQYEFQTISISTQSESIQANILLGASHQSGQNGSSERRTNREPDINMKEQFDWAGSVTWWQGASDILFDKGLWKIDQTLSNAPEELSHNLFDPATTDRVSEEAVNHFFELQMSYLLLWTVIERFLNIRYASGGEADNNDWKQMAATGAFASRLQEVVSDERQGSVILSLRTAQGTPTLDRDDPESAIEYYRRLRNNIAHRGKGAGPEEYEALFHSCEELMSCFKDTLDAAFSRSEQYLDDEDTLNRE